MSVPRCFGDRTGAAVLPPLASFVDPWRGNNPQPYAALQEEVERAERVKDERGGYGGEETSGGTFQGTGYGSWEEQNQLDAFCHNKWHPSYGEANNSLQAVMSLRGGGFVPNPGTQHNGEDNTMNGHRMGNNYQRVKTEMPVPAFPEAEVVSAQSVRRRQNHRGGRQREKTPPFQTEEEKRQWDKERRKKDIHNRIEQRRRYNINDRINDLGTLLINGGRDVRQNKGAILKETISYIRNLLVDQQKLKNVEEASEKVDQSNQRIFLRIQTMCQFLSTNGCFFPSEFIGSSQYPSCWAGHDDRGPEAIVDIPLNQPPSTDTIKSESSSPPLRDSCPLPPGDINVRNRILNMTGTVLF